MYVSHTRVIRIHSGTTTINTIITRYTYISYVLQVPGIISRKYKTETAQKRYFRFFDFSIFLSFLFVFFCFPRGSYETHQKPKGNRNSEGERGGGVNKSTQLGSAEDAQGGARKAATVARQLTLQKKEGRKLANSRTHILVLVGLTCTLFLPRHTRTSTRIASLLFVPTLSANIERVWIFKPKPERTLYFRTERNTYRTLLSREPGGT